MESSLDEPACGSNGGTGDDNFSLSFSNLSSSSKSSVNLKSWCNECGLPSSRIVGDSCNGQNKQTNKK